MRRTIIISTGIFMMIVLMVFDVLAQAPPPSSNPPGAPIDGLVGLLLIAGAGYGIKRYNE